MTTYVPIPNGDIDQDSPITQPLMTALRDNPIAIAEDDASAPKIKRKVKIQTGATATFSNLGTYGGCIVQGAFCGGSGPSAADFTVEVSDDGTTYYGTTTLLSGLAASATRPFSFSLDFETGAYLLVGGSSYISLFSATGTITGASLAITHVRFVAVSSGATGYYFMEPNGGIT